MLGCLVSVIIDHVAGLPSYPAVSWPFARAFLASASFLLGHLRPLSSTLHVVSPALVGNYEGVSVCCLESVNSLKLTPWVAELLAGSCGVPSCVKSRMNSLPHFPH